MQGDSIHTPCHMPFPILNQSTVPHLVPLLLLDLHRGFSGGRYGGVFKNFLQFVVIHTVKGVSVANEAEVDAYPEFICFSYDPTNVGHLTSGSSIFSKSNLYIWKFLVHILLKPSLKDFDHVIWFE